jgi:hypothetical protein
MPAACNQITAGARYALRRAGTNALLRSHTTAQDGQRPSDRIRVHTEGLALAGEGYRPGTVARTRLAAAKQQDAGVAVLVPKRAHRAGHVGAVVPGGRADTGAVGEEARTRVTSGA